MTKQRHLSLPPRRGKDCTAHYLVIYAPKRLLVRAAALLPFSTIATQADFSFGIGPTGTLSRTLGPGIRKFRHADLDSDRSLVGEDGNTKSVLSETVGVTRAKIAIQRPRSGKSVTAFARGANTSTSVSVAECNAPVLLLDYRSDKMPRYCSSCARPR